MTTDKYENPQDRATETSIRDVHEAVTSLSGLVRNISSQVEDMAGVTNEIHEMVSYHHLAPGYNGNSGYDGFDDEEE